MTYEFIVTKSSAGILRLKEPGQGRARKVLTASQAARLIKRSRRQIYRLMADGALLPARKILGEWLISAAAIETLKSRPLARAPLPRALQSLFPEYRVQDLNAGRDKTLILSRILENGTAKDAAWAARRYGRASIAGFLKEDGARLLSARALRLWSLCYRVRPKPLADWRRGYAVA